MMKTNEQLIAQFGREFPLGHRADAELARNFLVYALGNARQDERAKTLAAVEIQIDGMYRNTFSDYSEHEFIDTCALYKMLQKARRTRHANLAATNNRP